MSDPLRTFRSPSIYDSNAISLVEELNRHEIQNVAKETTESKTNPIMIRSSTGRRTMA